VGATKICIMQEKILTNLIKEDDKKPSEPKDNKVASPDENCIT